MIYPIEITHIYIASEHNFFFVEDKGPERCPATDLAEAEVVQDAGLRGDRFFKSDPESKSQITFFQQEVHEELVANFNLPDLRPDRYRRNVCVRGFDIHSLIGREFTVGGIKFRGGEIAQPCKWMEVSVCVGAKAFLKDRSGIRARPLTGGILRRGLTELTLDGPLNPGLE